VLAGLLMFWALQASGYGFWFACAWLPFLLGLGLMALAWQSKTARWLHLRVHSAQARKFAISLPIPIRMAGWFLRTFKDRIHGLDTVPADQLLQALESTAAPENPVYIEVDDEDGERVEIYIG
jgi:hypothetical protein